jgi:anti-sigma regulatory factor (Ser/Thr protein kinase)
MGRPPASVVVRWHNSTWAPSLIPNGAGVPCCLDVRRQVERASSRAGTPAGHEPAAGGTRLRNGWRAGKGRRAMAGTAAARESVTIAGRPDRVAVARAIAPAVLGRQQPHSDTAVLLLSELVTNSVRHSRSGQPGQTVTVTVCSEGELVRVEVTDRSGATVPALRRGDAEAESRRGLHLVDSLAARWGFRQRDGHTTTWFELRRS